MDLRCVRWSPKELRERGIDVESTVLPRGLRDGEGGTKCAMRQERGS